MTLHLLLDGDMLAYEACAGSQDEVEDHPFHWTITCDHRKAWACFTRRVRALQEAAEADEVHVCLTSTENFRKALYEPYKAQRGRKPVGYGAFRERIRAEANGYRPWIMRGLEGDDLLGILATGPTLTGDKVIWSGDKDLKQVPGLHMNTVGKVERVEPDDGDYWHLMQTLTGDTTDNYPGCPGIGPAKAEAILFGHSPPWGTPAEAWEGVLAAFRKAKKTEEDALVQARVARILRAEDFDFVNKRPILWTPRKETPWSS
jgi:DNA polymerase I